LNLRRYNLAQCQAVQATIDAAAAKQKAALEAGAYTRPHFRST
jgi:hypothetical protein